MTAAGPAPVARRTPHLMTRDLADLHHAGVASGNAVTFAVRYFPLPRH
jgi:hypothetical protein